MQPKGLHALALAKRGFRVFPLPVDNSEVPVSELKKPKLSGDWKELATTDENQIARWWSQEDCNIAIATLPSDNLIVFDYDTKEGQHGEAGLKIHEMIYGLPDSLRVRTASGGLHVYLQAPPGCSIPNSASKLYRNVDVRGNRKGGYVVAPGSTFHDKPYTITHDGPLETVPEALVDLALSTGHRKSSVSRDDVIGQLDEPGSISRATYYLEHSAPTATKGAGSNDQTYRIACKVRDCGISAETCLDLMLEHWNETKSNPPWPAEKLNTVIEHAYEYAELPIGIDNGASVEFGVVPFPEAAKKRIGIELIGFNHGVDSLSNRDTNPLIEDILQQKGLSVVYGQSGSGKSFICLDLAFHVASGRPWHGGRKVKQGLVVYIAAEGGFGIFKRTRALSLKNNVRDIPLYISPNPVDLLREGRESDTTQVIRRVKDIEKESGLKCELLVIDTLSRVLSGGDENSSTDMGVLIKQVEKIRHETQSAVLIVHHSGKDHAKGARGWSGIRAAVDAEISIHEGKLSVTKQRDIDIMPPVKFKLEVVSVGQRESDGEEITSCVVNYLDAADIPAVSLLENAPYGVLKAAIALAELKIDMGEKEGQNRDALCRKMLAVDIEVKDIVKRLGKSRTAVSNQIAYLAEAKMLSYDGEGKKGMRRLLPLALDEWRHDSHVTENPSDIN